jgi:tetratricopeptide (TPR) repeat protein
MYKSTKAGLVALAAILLSSPAVSAAGSDYNSGISMYMHGRYEAAMPYLERAASDGGNAQVHYYLADTYYRLGKTADALEEYNYSYKLDPRSNVAAYCQQMIRTLQTYNPGKPNIVDPTTLPQYRNGTAAAPAPVAPRLLPGLPGYPATAAKGSGSAPAAPVAPVVSSRIITSFTLPQIPEAPTLTTYDEVRHWEYLDKARFVSQAKDNVKKAEVHQKTMAQLLKEARKIATSHLVPSKRAWGETEKTYRARLDRGGLREGTLVEPYEKAKADADVLVSNANMVLAACKRSADGSDGPVPTTIVPFNGEVYSTGANPFTDRP